MTKSMQQWNHVGKNRRFSNPRICQYLFSRTLKDLLLDSEGSVGTARVFRVKDSIHTLTL